MNKTRGQKSHATVPLMWLHVRLEVGGLPIGCLVFNRRDIFTSIRAPVCLKRQTILSLISTTGACLCI
jgi:hypothetical protein